MSNEVKRVPVDYDFAAVNPEFLRRLARIGAYADQKYGSWSQYTGARLVGDKSPINHALHHIVQFELGEPYDHFDGDIRWHLAAAGYNLGMEFHYVSRWGYVAHPLTINGPLEKLNSALDELAARAASNGGGSHPPPSSDEPLYKLDAIRRLIDGAAGRTTFALADDIRRVLDSARFAAPVKDWKLVKGDPPEIVEVAAPAPTEERRLTKGAFEEVSATPPRLCQAGIEDGKKCLRPAPFYQELKNGEELPLCGDHAKDWLGAAIEVKARDEASAKILATL